MEFTYCTVALSDIDDADRLFQLRPVEEIQALARSIAALGVITPLTLQPRPGAPPGLFRYRLVRGFRRYAAAQAAGLAEIPARLVPADWEDQSVYQRMLEERSALTPLPPLQAARAIATLRQLFAEETPEIVRTWLPRMGLAANPKLVALYEPLTQLEAELQAALAADALGIETAGWLAAVTAAERRAFWQLNQQLRLGKNRQREFWLLLADAAALKKRSISDLLADPALAALLADAELTPSQKSDRVKNLLLQLRYPDYSALQARFEALARAAKLPPEIHLRSTPWFAGEEYFIDFSFTSAEEFTRRLEVLQKMQEKGLIAALAELT